MVATNRAVRSRRPQASWRKSEFWMTPRTASGCRAWRESARARGVLGEGGFVEDAAPGERVQGLEVERADPGDPHHRVAVHLPGDRSRTVQPRAGVRYALPYGRRHGPRSGGHTSELQPH